VRHRITRALAMLTAPVVLATVVTTAHAAVAATPVHYQVTLIRAANGAFGVVPYALNAAGHTAGDGSFPDDGAETGYVSTSPTQLAKLPGLVPNDPTLATATLGYGINSADTVVGYAFQTLPIRETAVVWRNGTPTDLNILPADGQVEARGINDAGQIAGTGFDTGTAWLYQNGRTTILPPLPGGKAAEAFGISADGQVLGLSATSNDTTNAEATVWRNGTPRDLGSLRGSTWSEAHAMNSSGVVVGAAGVGGGEFAPRHPVMFAGGKVTDLWPDLGGSTFGTANAINRAGTIVGDGRDGWVYSNGVRTDLTTLIPADSGLNITAAYAINDAGQIAASAAPVGNHRQQLAVLLTPVAG
jgi:probable HAF family extracellular repeat protein